MRGETKEVAIPDEIVMNQIYRKRGLKVMFDRDLARLYNVQTSYLNKAVNRNLKRFPDEDFMFQLSEDEFKNLMFQNGTSRWGGTRKRPYVFTEQGVAMLLWFEMRFAEHLEQRNTFVFTISIQDCHCYLPSKFACTKYSGFLYLCTPGTTARLSAPSSPTLCIANK